MAHLKIGQDKAAATQGDLELLGIDHMPQDPLEQPTNQTHCNEQQVCAALTAAVLRRVRKRAAVVRAPTHRAGRIEDEVHRRGLAILGAGPSLILVIVKHTASS